MGCGSSKIEPVPTTQAQIAKQNGGPRHGTKNKIHVQPATIEKPKPKQPQIKPKPLPVQEYVEKDVFALDLHEVPKVPNQYEELKVENKKETAGNSKPAPKEHHTKNHVLDVRKKPWKQGGKAPPNLSSGNLFTDADFTQKVAMRGLQPNNTIIWQRPKDFCSEPVLLRSYETSRFDIKQGEIGNCWFMSVLSVVAGCSGMIKKIIPENPGALFGERYNGLFHCRFYYNGEWHDVYCDDYLPVRQDLQRPWGAESPDKSVMWVSLVEKALAKFLGGYKSIVGRSSEFAFQLLTGGYAQANKHQEVTAKELFQKIDLAFASKYLVVCSSPSNNGVREISKTGIVLDHAHAITGHAKIQVNNQEVFLIRVRNPWGNERGQWLGKWSHNSDIWNQVPEHVKTLKINDTNAGEYWISLEDFYRFFEATKFLTLHSPFDVDKTFASLDKECKIMADWKGKGVSKHDIRMDEIFTGGNCYTFTVPQIASGTDTTIPVLLYIERVDPTKPPTDKLDKDTYILPDIYKLSEEMTYQGERFLALERQTFNNTYLMNGSWKYQLMSGTYFITPHSLHEIREGQNCSYILKIISNITLKASKVSEPPKGVYGKPSSMESEHAPDMDKECATIADWNGWGQNDFSISMENVFTDYQGFSFHVPEKDLTPAGTLPVTIYISKVDTGGASASERISFLPDLYKVQATIIREDGGYMALERHTKDNTFLVSGCWKYDLQPGQYIITPHTYQQLPRGANFKFVVVLISRIHLQAKLVQRPPKGIFPLSAKRKETHTGRAPYIKATREIYMEWKNLNKQHQIQISLEISKTGKKGLPVWLAFTGASYDGEAAEIPWPPFKIYKMNDPVELPANTGYMTAGLSWSPTNGFYNDNSSIGGNLLLAPGYYLINMVYKKKRICFSLGLEDDNDFKDIHIKISPDEGMACKMLKL